MRKRESRLELPRQPPKVSLDGEQHGMRGHLQRMANRQSPKQATGVSARQCPRCGALVDVLVTLRGRDMCEGCAYGRPR